MLANELRKPLERVEAGLVELLADPAGLTDRVRWLAVFDHLDELKDDLQQGNGGTWPPAVRATYVAVRTGVRELFGLLFNGPADPPIPYCVGWLSTYVRRLRKVLAPYTRAGVRTDP